jgi:hypothetical protein
MTLNRVMKRVNPNEHFGYADDDYTATSFNHTILHRQATKRLRDDRLWPNVLRRHLMITAEAVRERLWPLLESRRAVAFRMAQSSRQTCA